MLDLVIDKDLFKDYFLNNSENNLKLIPNTNNINILIGSNNSGKSRFIRSLMIQENCLCFEEYDKIITKIELYNQKVTDINSGIESHMEKFNRRTTWSTSGGRDFEKERANLINSCRIKKLDINNHKEILSVFQSNHEMILKLKSAMLDVYSLEDFEKFDEEFFIDYSDFNRYYIPTLRTAHSLFDTDDKSFVNEEDTEKSSIKLKKIENDILLLTYKRNYEINDKIKIFTGLHLYREILNARNSKRDRRKKFEEFENFVGKYFFNDKKIDIVAEFSKEKNLSGKNEDENINIYIEGEKETRYIFELGDGIQALIILMYQIFMAERNSLIFIDEPEINLHPGMQRLFLEQISSNPYLLRKKIKYFITTHSNHFLDLTIEKDNISIYSLSGFINEKGENKFILKNVNDGDNKILRELGVNNSSVFLANSSIWVEGISDRNYIKAFLKSYLKQLKKTYSLKEDIDFAFFEYAGSNIEHYLFSENLDANIQEIVVNDINSFSLSNRIFLLADSDNSKKNTTKGKRLVNFEKLKSDNFFPKIIWNIREIENLLTDDIWKEILIELCDKTLVKKDSDSIQKKIDKAVIEIKSKDYSTEYIGNYLNAIRDKLGKIGTKYILNKSSYMINSDGSFGTFVDKRFLSEKVFEKDFSWEIFSKNAEIKKLTEEIYNFIKNDLN